MRHEKNINHMTITNTLFFLPTLIFFSCLVPYNFGEVCILYDRLTLLAIIN